MTRELKILVGIPASGKSTWAKKEQKRLQEMGLSCTIVSRDDIRKSLLQNNKNYFAKEKEVFKKYVDYINDGLAAEIDTIIADATHINDASRYKLLRNLHINDNTDIVFEVFSCPLEDAIARNAYREGFEKVPVEVITTMMNKFEMPHLIDGIGIRVHHS